MTAEQAAEIINVLYWFGAVTAYWTVSGTVAIALWVGELRRRR